jgi:hypothetical protein
MAQKIMTRVRAEARPKKSLFQKLFYPLHIKLPIEAVATVLVIGLALYVYRDIQPEVRLAQAPVGERTPQDSLKQLQPVPPSVKKDKKELPSRGVPSPAKPSELPVSSGEKEAKAGKKEAVPEVKTHPEKREAPGAPAPAKERDVTPAAGFMAKDEAHQEVRAAAPKTKLSSMEKKDEKVLSFTVLVKDPETALKEIEKTVTKLEGRMIRAQSVEEKRTVTAEMRGDRLKELVEKLKSLGKLKEKEIDFEAMKGEAGIRIEVVPIPEGR